MFHRTSPRLSRREVLTRIGGGFGALGLATVLADAGLLAATAPAAARQPAGPQGAALSAPREADHLPVHERRAVARRHVRPQAGAQRARGRGRSRVPADQDEAEGQGEADALALHVPTVRRKRHRGLRAVSRGGAVHRRHLRAALDVDGQSQSRAGPVDDELRQHAAHPPQPGLVADLCPGFGEPEPARLRRALSGQAGRRSAALEQQLPAGHLSGNAHQQQIDRSQDHYPRRR